jgi:hypothetical protein
LEVFMAKLSEEAKKKIAEAVKRSWALRRAKLATAKAAPAGAPGMKRGAVKSRRRLSADARRRIAEAVKRSWATRRAGRPVALGGGKLARATADRGILAAVERASQALRSLTLDDLRPLTGRRDAVVRLDELATLASDLKRLIAP